MENSSDGGVAQVVRACGSYPQCPGFKSLHRHFIPLFFKHIPARTNPCLFYHIMESPHGRRRKAAGPVRHRSL